MWDKVDSILREKGITPHRLSKMMGDPNDSNVYALKNGRIKKPSFELMVKIAKALDVSLDEFR